MTFVAVHKTIVQYWLHRPFSELVAAAKAGTEGIGEAGELSKAAPEPKKEDPRWLVFPRLQNYAIFRLGTEFGRPDVAAYHAQNW